MIFGCGASLLERALDDFINHDAVFGVHADKTAAFARSRHGSKYCCVVNQEHAGVGHKHLEARYTFIHRSV
jgi:hypothetical protein